MSALIDPTSADRTDDETDRLSAPAQLDDARWMLSLAMSLNATRSEQGIRARLSRLMTGVRDSVGADLHLPGSWQQAGKPARAAALDECVQAQSIVWHADSAPPNDVAGVICVPVVGPTGLLAVLELQWRHRPCLDEAARAWFTSVAAHVAAALERAQLLERRTGIAHQLQAAMLSPLPQLAGLDLAACYVPASDDEWVGGDWYDAALLPRDEQHDLRIIVTVGDVMGHDLPAAAMMGQARALLRHAALTHADLGPAHMFERFEETCAALGVEATGSAVLALLERSSQTGRWQMRWTSAGHPPPIVTSPHGDIRRLELSPDEQGMLFGYRDVYDAPRHESHLDLESGSTVLFYSDGVIEVPGATLEAQMDELGDLLQSEHHRGPEAVVGAISMNFGTGYDDVVALAVRVPTA